jgi:hypothetical protein
MNRRLLIKTLALSIIFLFIGVSLSSAISVDTKSNVSNNESEECRECNEISDADLVIVERLLNRVEVYSKLLVVLSSYNPEIEEMSKELSNLKYTNNTLDFREQICDILEKTCANLGGIIDNIGILLSELSEDSILFKLILPVGKILLSIWIFLYLSGVFLCGWHPYYPPY